MDIIALTVLGFAIALFMLFWFNRHVKSKELLMQHNHNVQPLFKQKSATLKYHALRHTLKNETEAFQKLQQLHQKYIQKQINLEVYHDALDDLERQYMVH